MIHQLIKDKKLYLVPSARPEYDTNVHMLKVMEYAVEHACQESLERCFERLCCRNDEVVIAFAEDPYNFFWCLYNRDEFERLLDDCRNNSIPPIQMRGRYHGGVIAHTVYKDGEATAQKEWSVHT